MRIVALLSVILWMTGCASVKIAAEKTFAVPQKDKATATVYFYREKHFSGAVLSYNIWENEGAPRKLGALQNGSYFFVYLPPGEHTFFVSGEAKEKVSIKLKSGETYYYQFVLDDNGIVAPRPRLTGITESSALDYIKNENNELEMTTLDPALERKPAPPPPQNSWPK